jgi:hypothetical protein
MRALFVLPVLAVLAGCGSQETQAPKGSSFAEVLPGSASDAMLPYDTATSAPPLAPYRGSASGESEENAPAPAPGTRASESESEPEPEAS